MNKILFLTAIVAALAGVSIAKDCYGTFISNNLLSKPTGTVDTEDLPVDPSPPEDHKLVGILVSSDNDHCGSCKKCRDNAGKPTNACGALDAMLKKNKLMRRDVTPTGVAWANTRFDYRFYVYLKNGETAGCTF